MYIIDVSKKSWQISPVFVLSGAMLYILTTKDLIRVNKNRNPAAKTHSCYISYISFPEATSSIYLNQYRLDIDTGSIRLFPDPTSPIQPPQPEWTNLEVSDDIEMLELELQDDLVVGAR